MDVFSVFERALRKMMGISRKDNPYNYAEYRKYLTLANMNEEDVERALKYIIDNLPRTDKPLVFIAPGRSGRRLFWILKEALKEYNPHNVTLHRINMITLPVSARSSLELVDGIPLSAAPEDIAELALDHGKTAIYRNVARAIKSGEAVPVFLDSMRYEGRTEQMYNHFLKRLGLDPENVHKIVLFDAGKRYDQGMDEETKNAIASFVGNFIESDDAIPVSIEKRATSAMKDGRRFIFYRYERRRKTHKI